MIYRFIEGIQNRFSSVTVCILIQQPHFERIVGNPVVETSNQRYRKVDL
jgi:hypothetical protein